MRRSAACFGLAPCLLGKGIGKKGEAGRPRKQLTGAIGPSGATKKFVAMEYHVTWTSANSSTPPGVPGEQYSHRCHEPRGVEPSHGCWEMEGPNKARDVCRGGLVWLLSWGNSDGGWSNKSSDSSDDEGSVTVDVENDNDDDGPDNRVGVRVQELDDDLNVQTEGVELNGPPQTVEEEDQESAMQESDSKYGRDPTCTFKTDTREKNEKIPGLHPKYSRTLAGKGI